MMNTRVRGVGVFRTIYFLPFVTTWVAISIVFKYIFNEQFGLLNYFLEGLGLPTFAWLNESRGIFEMIPRDGLNLPLPEKIHPPACGSVSLRCFSAHSHQQCGEDTGCFLGQLQASLACRTLIRPTTRLSEIDGASPRCAEIPVTLHGRF